MTSLEDLLCLGTNHVAGIIRNASAGQKGCIKSITNARGLLDVEKMMKDPEMKIMMIEGYNFKILVWQCEATWPKLPDFVQRALNANNGITGDPTEWDLAMLLADCFNSMADSSWDQAIDAAVSQAPASEKIIKDIKDLVQLHGGGAPVFLLHKGAGGVLQGAGRELSFG